MFEKLFARRGLSLDRLRVLCEVAEAGGIAKAAGDDPTRQSQFSRQLKELEDFFEIELTRRRGKGIALTDAGERLAQVARNSLRMIEDFQAGCRAEPVTFTIGAGDSLIHWLLLPRVGRLQRALPAVNLSIENLRTADIVKRLLDLRLDFGCVRKDAVNRPLVSKAAGRIEYALFCPRDLARGKSGRDWRWFLRNVPLALGGGDGAFGRAVREIEAGEGTKLRLSLHCESFPQAQRALLSGAYASILPTLARAELPADQFIEMKVPPLAGLTREICLAWNPRIARLRPVAETVGGRLAELLRE